MNIFKEIIRHHLFRHRLLFGIIIPVIGAGLVFSFALNAILMPRIVTYLKDMNNAMIRNCTAMEMSFCEDKFAYLLELRMEENKKMNDASKKESLKNIKTINRRFPEVRMAIVDKTGKILSATFKLPFRNINKLKLNELNKFLYPGFDGQKIIALDLFQDKVMANLQYFPFYQWTIISFIPKKDYMAPVFAAKRIVSLGTFGTVIITAFILLLLFLMKINTPLKKIIKATDNVSRGKFTPIEVKGYNEISHLSTVFNSMIKNLSNNNKKINMILHDLRQSKDQYKSLAENSLAGISIMQNSRIVYANSTMAKLVGYNMDDLKLKSFKDLVHPDYLEKNSIKINRLQKGKSEKEYCQSCFKTKNGQLVFLDILASAIPFNGARAVLIHGIDITEKRNAEIEQEKLKEKLATAEKMELVGTLAGGVAHDLNNILSGVVSYPELLLMDMKEDNPIYKPLVIIQQSGMKAAAIVQDMLTLTRRGVIVKKIIDLNTIIKDYLKSPEFKALESFHPDVRVEFNPAPGLILIQGSPVHLSKAVMNLVGNAAEAMPDGGKICIATKNYFSDKSITHRSIADESINKSLNLETGNYAVISISDTGTGISSEDIKKIFEPFYTKKIMGRSGTGLGMSVVWGAVKDHNGYIDIQSTHGKGTCFTLYFPVEEQKNPETACENIPFSFTQCRGNGESILVVDDMETQRLIASQMLIKLGYSVNTAASGEEAVKYIKNYPVDLVMLDMIMDPGIDGLETYQRILKENPGQKGIIASGFSETGRVKEAERLGIGAYVKKPYIFEQIAVAIKKVLKK